ncbi:MAG TPA: MgtC/SapB family protein [Rhizomicrobium sp.]|jgi:putative Mg2+ transporter-C (MgtC) family protein
MSTLDIILRLGVAALAGAILGFNRDMHGKPTGIRTLGLVSLGVAIATVGVLTTDVALNSTDAYSRILQGIVQGVLTGIGFLGGGVILRNPRAQAVHNLTTAATVWVTSAIGIVCAVANWKVIGIGMAMAVALLLIGDRFDKWIARHYPESGSAEERKTDRPQE